MPYTEEQKNKFVRHNGFDPSLYTYDENTGYIIARDRPVATTAPEPPKAGIFEAAFETATEAAVPTALGLGAGLAAAPFTSGLSLVPSLVTIGGASVAGGVVGGIAQDKLLSAIQGEPARQERREELARLRQERPLATLAGEFIPSLVALSPSQSLKTAGTAARGLSRQLLTSSNKLPGNLAPRLSQAERVALADVTVGSGVEAGVEAGSQALFEDEFDPTRIAAAGALGVLINEPNSLLRKITGHGPTTPMVAAEENATRIETAKTRPSDFPGVPAVGPETVGPEAPQRFLLDATNHMRPEKQHVIERQGPSQLPKFIKEPGDIYRNVKPDPAELKTLADEIGTQDAAPRLKTIKDPVTGKNTVQEITNLGTLKVDEAALKRRYEEVVENPTVGDADALVDLRAIRNGTVSIEEQADEIQDVLDETGKLRYQISKEANEKIENILEANGRPKNLSAEENADIREVAYETARNRGIMAMFEIPGFTSAGVAYTGRGQRSIGLSKELAGLDTPFHEIVHILNSDIANYGSKAASTTVFGKAMSMAYETARDLNQALGKTAKGQPVRAEEVFTELTGRRAAEIVANRVGRKYFKQIKNFFQDFASNVKNHFGAADLDDLVRLHARTTIDSPPTRAAFVELGTDQFVKTVARFSSGDLTPEEVRDRFQDIRNAVERPDYDVGPDGQLLLPLPAKPIITPTPVQRALKGELARIEQSLRFQDGMPLFGSSDLFELSLAKELRKPKPFGLQANKNGEVNVLSLKSRLSQLPTGERAFLTRVGLDHYLEGKKNVSLEDVQSFATRRVQVKIHDFSGLGDRPIDVENFESMLARMNHELETTTSPDGTYYSFRFEPREADIVVYRYNKVTGETHVGNIHPTYRYVGFSSRDKEQFFAYARNNKIDLEGIRQQLPYLRDVIEEEGYGVSAGPSAVYDLNPRPLGELNEQADLVVQADPDFFGDVQQNEAHIPGKRGKNAIGFLRTNIETLPTGERILHVYEMQSDWLSELQDIQKSLKSFEEFKKSPLEELPFFGATYPLAAIQDGKLIKDWNTIIIRVQIPGTQFTQAFNLTLKPKTKEDGEALRNLIESPLNTSTVKDILSHISDPEGFKEELRKAVVARLQGTEQRQRTKQLNLSNPFVEYAYTLLAKTAIAHAIKKNANFIAISDSKTVTLTESHFVYTKIKDPEAILKKAKELGMNEDVFDRLEIALTSLNKNGEPTKWVDFAWEILSRNPEFQPFYELTTNQLKGMEHFYDKTYPNIFKKLTGASPNYINFGRHVNADDIFHEDITARLFPLHEVKARLFNDKRFTVAGARFQEASDIGQRFSDAIDENIISQGGRPDEGLFKKGGLFANIAQKEARNFIYKLKNTPRALSQGLPIFRSVVDRVAHELGEGGRVLAANFHKFFVYRDGYTGLYKNKAANILNRPGINLNNINKYGTELYEKGESSVVLTENETKAYNELRKLLVEVQEEQNRLGIKVKYIDPEGKTAYRAAIVQPDYWPVNVIDAKLIRTISNQPASSQALILKQQWIDHQRKSYGINTQEAENLWDKFRANVNRYPSARFAGVRKEKGMTVPQSWREPATDRLFARYFNRVSADYAYFRAIENNPLMRGLLDKPDQFGKRDSNILVNKSQESGVAGSILQPLANNDDVKKIMEFVELNHSYEDAFVDSANRFVKSLMLQTLTGTKDVISAPFLIFPHLEIKDAVNIFRGALGTNQGIERALKTGVAQERTVSAQEIGSDEGLSTATQLFNMTADFMYKYSGREVLEKVARGWTMQVGYLTALSHLKQGKFNSEFLTLVKPIDFDELVQAGRFEELAEKAGANLVRITQGTYDVRGLPKFVVSGPLSPIFNLAKWNIERGNNFAKHVITPMIRDKNPKPFLKAVLSGFMAGSLIEWISEQFTGNEAYWPKWDELEASESDIEDFAYRSMALMTLGGTGGVLADAIKFPGDVKFKNSSQGFSFQLYDFTADLLEKIRFAQQAIREGEHPFKVFTQFGTETAKDHVQAVRLMRRALEAGGHLEQDEQERINRNRRRDLRVFEVLNDYPINEFSGSRRNPFSNQDVKEFKTTQDLGRARDLLLNSILPKYKKEFGDNPELLSSKVQGLKNNSFRITPNPETEPVKFKQYMDFVNRTADETPIELLKAQQRQRLLNQSKL